MVRRADDRGNGRVEVSSAVTGVRGSQRENGRGRKGRERKVGRERSEERKTEERRREDVDGEY